MTSADPGPAANSSPVERSSANISHAWVESPLQLVSAVEARLPDEQLEIHARIDAEGMDTFLARFRSEWLPAGVTIVAMAEIDPQLFTTRSGRLLIGDLCSGRLQRAMLASGLQLRRPVVVIDDGFATLHAVRELVSRRPRPLVRPRQKTSRSRRAAAFAVAVLLRAVMHERRLSWTTALPVPDELIISFTAAGGTVRRHTFEYVRSLPDAGSRVPERIIIGSALAADDLITADAYFDWLATTVERLQPSAEAPVAYYAHRRETPELLARVAQLPHVTVRHAHLPVEIRLTTAPAGAQVHSLPTSAVANLPATMQEPNITVTAIPSSWWTGTAPDRLRQQLNAAAAAPDTDGSEYRIVAIADSESYLKWAARVLDSLGPDIDAQLWIIDTPIRPTAGQISHALAGSSWAGTQVPVVERAELHDRLTAAGADVVLAAATGPVVQQIAATAHRLPRRPGLATGLPGIGLPARQKGVRYRRDCDLFLAHSHHEREAYRAAATRAGVPLEITVARLPLLTSTDVPEPAFDMQADGTAPVPTRIVFAPQAKVPTDRQERIAILRALAAFARRHPDSETIVKVRSLPGEQETHHEEHSYLSLIQELTSSGELAAGELSIAVGPMDEFLTAGSALVTVSSTAALESIDRGLQTLIISDFGVSEALLNAVFDGSGILGSLQDLSAGRIGFPNETWLQENYFHPPSVEVNRAFRILAARSQQYQLRSQPWIKHINSWRAVRAELRTAAPQPVVDGYRFAVKQVRRLSRRLR